MDRGHPRGTHAKSLESCHVDEFASTHARAIVEQRILEHAARRGIRHRLRRPFVIEVFLETGAHLECCALLQFKHAPQDDPLRNIRVAVVEGQRLAQVDSL